MKLSTETVSAHRDSVRRSVEAKLSFMTLVAQLRQTALFCLLWCSVYRHQLNYSDDNEN